MKTGTMVDYAVSRTRNHLGRFSELYSQITQNRVDPEYVAHLEWKDAIFENMDYSVYSPQGVSAG